MLDHIKRKVLSSKFLNPHSRCAPSTPERKWQAIEDLRATFGPSVLIETGTFMGDTVEHFRDRFQKLYSIELQPDLHRRAVARFAGEDNVRIIFGDSGVEINKLLVELDGPALFWLDGHYSSEFMYKGEHIKTARATKDTPVMEEISAILGAKADHIVLIDDLRMFNGTSGYPRLPWVKQTVARLKPSYNVKTIDDMIFITPPAPKRG